MRKEWIVKLAPRMECGRRIVTGDVNKAYNTRTGAEAKANRIALKTGKKVMVWESVACFDGNRRHEESEKEEEFDMKKFWTVKKASCGGPRIDYDENKRYFNSDDAHLQARALAGEFRCGFVVLEAIDFYDVKDVVRVPFDGEAETKLGH